MDLMTVLESLVTDLEAGLDRASSLDELEELRVDFLGRKGKLAQAMSSMAKLPPAERPAVGQKANSVKERLTALFDARKTALEAAREAEALKRFDPSLPGRAPWRGSLHPTTLVMEEICGIFSKLGFDIASGPEVENDFYNFESLNMPPEHPARDMQDTLYITERVLMRTHTSPVQVRTMLGRKPPLAIVAPGKVYRRDSDLTHTPMFHQVEGLVVGQNISMAHLRGTLTAFVRSVFGGHTEVRFRPSFFPFTEPSAEVDLTCSACHGKGCRICKDTGWVEVLGCGMVNPKVLEMCGIDSHKYSGFAFGIGLERIAMKRYGITDMRLLYEGDARLLGQLR